MSDHERDDDDDCDDRPQTLADVTQTGLVAALLGAFGDVPLSTRVSNAVIRAADLVMAEIGKADVPTAPDMGLAAWLQSDDTGLSSLYLASVLAPLAGLPQPYCRPSPEYCPAYPHDPADFGRCVRLFEAEPRLKPHLGRMAANHGPQWSALVAAWPELEALYAEELPSYSAPKMYARMQAIITEAEKSTP